MQSLYVNDLHSEICVCLRFGRGASERFWVRMRSDARAETRRDPSGPAGRTRSGRPQTSRLSITVRPGGGARRTRPQNRGQRTDQSRASRAGGLINSQLQDVFNLQRTSSTQKNESIHLLLKTISCLLYN